MKESKRSMKERHAVHAQNKTLHDNKNAADRFFKVSVEMP